MIFPDLYESDNYSEIIFLSYFFEYGFYSAQTSTAASGNQPQRVDVKDEFFVPKTHRGEKRGSGMMSMMSRKNLPLMPPQKRRIITAKRPGAALGAAPAGGYAKTTKKKAKRNSKAKKAKKQNPKTPKATI